LTLTFGGHSPVEKKEKKKRKISDRDPQRAWGQEELTGGKLPVVK
jgi:hypothetical protein